MNIEVTKETFFKLFDAYDMGKSEKLELAQKQHYFNPKLEQKGIAIYNYISNVWQYYLTDINA